MQSLFQTVYNNNLKIISRKNRKCCF